MSKPRARTRRRVLERQLEKLSADREKLFLLEPGGSPERPIRVAASPIVDIRAASIPCPLCQGALRLDEHAADVIDGRSVRIARLTCRGCGTPRTIYFELAPPLAN